MGLTCRGARTELAEKAQKIIHVDATGAVQVGAGVRDFGARLAVCTTAPFQSCQGSGAPDPELLHSQLLSRARRSLTSTFPDASTSPSHAAPSAPAAGHAQCSTQDGVQIPPPAVQAAPPLAQTSAVQMQAWALPAMAPVMS